MFTFGVSLVAGILFGLVPAYKSSKSGIHETLKETGRGGSGARNRTQTIFVAVEMALALVLLVGAGLMVRSMAKLWKTDPGFDPYNVASFSLASSQPWALRRPPSAPPIGSFMTRSAPFRKSEPFP